MNTFHVCKTKTTSECNPSTHSSYKAFLDELNHQSDTLKIAQKELSQTSHDVVFSQATDEFTLPLYHHIIGLYLCDVKVNGHSCRFIIDTGAQLSSIRYDAMKRIGIKQSTGKIEIGSALGTKKDLNGCVLDKFEFGSSQFEALPVLCLDKDDFSLQLGNIEIFNFDGILGWDILRNFDFEIDTIAKKLKIMKNRFKFNYQNMVSGMFPIFLVKDDLGNLLKLGFDSGSRRSWISKETAERYQYPMNGEVKAMGFGVHGMEHMHLQLYSKVNFHLFKASITIHNLMSGNCHILPDIQCDGVLGNEIFKNRRIRIINSKGIVLLV